MTPRAAVAGPEAGSEVVIGLDVGTTATKAVAFQLGSAWRHVAIREYPLLSPREGWKVQEPDAIRTAVVSALTECVAALGGVQPVGVAVSTAMHGLIGLSAELEPRTPLVTWADARSLDQARGLRASDLATDLHRISGTPIHPMTPLTKLMWFSRHEPELVASVRWWAGLKDFVLSILTGEVATELSTASGTALLDLSTREWNPVAVELAGIRAEQLPPVLATTATLRVSETAAQATGLPAGLPVVVGAGDGPLGNVGTAAIHPGVAGLSLGTSGAVRMLVPAPYVDPAGRLFCYALTDTQWVIGGAVSNGGAVVRWAGGVFGQAVQAGTPPDAELLELAASVPPGSDGLFMLPYLLPERAPLWQPDLRGAYLNIQHGHTRAHFVRAAVEGVAFQLATVVEALDRVHPVATLRATGGALRAALWREVLAAALARPLTVTAGAEGSALGVAALGLVGLGRAADLPQALAMLGPGKWATPVEVPEVAGPDDIAYYRGVRASLPRLLSAYNDVAELFA